MGSLNFERPLESRKEQIMKKILRPMFLVILIISIFLVNKNVKEAAIYDGRENIIFCEDISMGMNMNAVLLVLHRYGDIDYGTATFGENLKTLQFHFLDKEVVGNTNSYLLSFRNRSLSGISHQLGWERWEAVCD